MKIYIIIFCIAATVVAVVSMLAALFSSPKRERQDSGFVLANPNDRKKKKNMGLLAGCVLGVLSIALLGFAASRRSGKRRYSRSYLRSRKGGLLALDLSFLGRY